MQTQDVSKMEEVFKVHAEAELATDIEATMATLTADPHYELITVGWHVRGQAAVREMYSRLYAGYNRRVTASTGRVLAVAPDALIREGYTTLSTGTGTATYHSIAVITFEHDRISGERLYADMPNAQLMRDALGADFGRVPGVSALF